VQVAPTLTDDLYHYTSAEIALDSVMTQRQLRLGLLESTNDPRESRARYPNLRLADGVPDEAIDSIWQEADRLVRRAAKVACFTLDFELPDSVLDPSALRGYAHPSLWAHYGGGHAGVSLRFSRRALADRMRGALASRGQLFDGAVDYAAEAFRESDVTGFDVEQVDEFGLDAIVVRYIERHHRELFFRKHSDWSSEQEYRWVLVEPEPVAVHVDITDCLTGIVLGDAFPQGRLDTVYQLAEHSGGIDVATVKFHNGRLTLLPGTAPPSRVPRTHRRSGTLRERASALAQAEADAAHAYSRGEQFAARVVDRINAAIREVGDRTRALSAVEVEVHRSIHAVPLSERRRAAGVSTYATEYEHGAMCVVENMPRYSVTFVASVAVQVLTGDRVKLHASYEVERWLPTGNEGDELWRLAREAHLDETAALQVTDELITAMLDHLQLALTAFQERRDASRSEPQQPNEAAHDGRE